MAKLFALVFRVISEAHRRVIPNVWLTLTVHKIKRALIKSVEILALELVVLVRSAQLSTIIQFVVVPNAIQAIHSSVANQ